MIQAREAYERAVSQKAMIDFRKDIEKEIEKAVSEGKLKCEVMFDCGLPDSVRHIIADELIKLGYEVEMPNYEAQDPYTPCDQAKYCDYLKIYWRGSGK